MSTLGKRLREARENKGLMQHQLAKLIGAKSAGVISNWENGLNKPDVDKIALLCKVLEVSPSFLLDISQDDAFICSPAEQNFIECVRSLDCYGKRAVELILMNECERVSAINNEDRPYRIVARGDAGQAQQLSQAENLASLEMLFNEQFGEDSDGADKEKSDQK